MTLTTSEDHKICNNCGNSHETRLFDITLRVSLILPIKICLCVTCIDELKGLICELELFK